MRGGPVLGILEKEQEQSVVQGSIDFGKTIVTDSRYKEPLEKAAQLLRIRPHKSVVVDLSVTPSRDSL